MNKVHRRTSFHARHSRWPSFASLHGEQSENSLWYTIISEIIGFPCSPSTFRFVFSRSEIEEASSGRKNRSILLLHLFAVHRTPTGILQALVSKDPSNDRICLWIIVRRWPRRWIETTCRQFWKDDRSEVIRFESDSDTYNIVNTFDREVMTQSKTAFSFGTRLIVFNGRKTRRTRRDLIVFRFLPAPFSLIRDIIGQTEKPWCSSIDLRETKRDQCANDDQRIEQIPDIATVGSFVQNQA